MLTGSVEPCLRSKFRYGFFCNKDLCDNFADCRRNLSGNSFVLSSQYIFTTSFAPENHVMELNQLIGRLDVLLRNYVTRSISVLTVLPVPILPETNHNAQRHHDV